jgi:hypothetical protein
LVLRERVPRAGGSIACCVYATTPPYVYGAVPLSGDAQLSFSCHNWLQLL